MGAFTIDKPMRHEVATLMAFAAHGRVSEGIERKRVLIQAFQAGEKNESGEAPGAHGKLFMVEIGPSQIAVIDVIKE